MIQYIIVGLIGLLVMGYVGRSLWRMLTGKPKSGGGCSGCDGCGLKDKCH
ncbi:MAG: FeoB-associated Cys-rich membrane protein [Porphyromonadaceae bacterium]|nr:FeoB-associated Cys-rich membrane protein [Porphyromonadaceae bacterium]